MATKTAEAPGKGHQTAGKTRLRAYPAPRKLAVPSDLKPDQIRAVVEAVNPLVADAFALYTKTKNFHWHVASSHFRDYHLLFDDQADDIFEAIDILAERVRRIGGTTIRSISHIGELQTIQDDDEEYVNPADMVSRLLADNLQIAAAQRKAIETCDDNKDSVTSNALQEILDKTEKRIWFLYEMSTSGEHAE